MSLRPLALVAAAALSLCAVTVHAAPVDLTVNGGFETGDFTGWVQFPSGAGQQTVISPGYFSTYAGCINNTVGTSGSVIKNANLGIGDVMPGETVMIEFEARGAGAVGGVAFAEFFSEIDGGGVSASVLLGGGPLALDPDPNTWKHFSFTTVTGPDVSGGVTLQFAAVTGAAAGSSMELYIDLAMVLVDRVATPVDAGSWGRIKSMYR